MSCPTVPSTKGDDEFPYIGSATGMKPLLVFHGAITKAVGPSFLNFIYRLPPRVHQHVETTFSFRDGRP